MNPTRVFVVDDAATVRGMVRLALERESDMELAGVASNGRLALKALEITPADVVVLDVEMPEMDGLTTLKELRLRFPALPVVMFSTLTESGAAVTVKALLAGARDYVTKPSRVKNPEEGLTRIQETLIPKLRALCSGAPKTRSIDMPPPQSLSPARPRQGPLRAKLVAVGSSTGGPTALMEFLADFPATFAAPMVVAQHMPAVFTRHLAERLNDQIALPVAEAVGGELLNGPGVWIAPGGRHLSVDAVGEWRLRVSDSEPVNFCRPSVDVLFHSVAKAAGPQALAVVLTGMGADGLEGAREILNSGGEVVSQDEDSSVVWGMPGAVTRAGLVTQTLPPHLLGEYVRSRVISMPEREVVG